MNKVREIYEHVTDTFDGWKTDYISDPTEHIERISQSDGFTVFIDKTAYDEQVRRCEALIEVNDTRLAEIRRLKQENDSLQAKVKR
jgi:hypothetical protein